MAGGIAHDLNNILTVISGNIGLVEIEAPTVMRGACSRSFPLKAGQALCSRVVDFSSQLLTFS